MIGTPETIFTGKPCRNGHVSPRRADNRDCLECVHARQKAWYEKNRVADLARKARWVAENIEKKRATDAAYYRANGAEIRERTSAYYAANLENGREARRRYRADNVERFRAYDAERHAKNPDRVKTSSRRRRAKLKGATGAHTAADVREITKAQRNRCAYCRADLRTVVRHVDHIKPLSRGGSDCRSNIQILCAPCNLSKHAADPLDFARRMGMLL